MSTLVSISQSIKCSTVMVIHGSIIRDKCKSIDGFDYDEVIYCDTSFSIALHVYSALYLYFVFCTCALVACFLIITDINIHWSGGGQKGTLTFW